MIITSNRRELLNSEVLEYLKTQYNYKFILNVSYWNIFSLRSEQNKGAYCYYFYWTLYWKP